MGHTRDLQRNAGAADRQRFPEGNHGNRDQGHGQGQDGRKNVEALVHVVRHQVFLQDELDAVGQRLQQSERAHARGSPAVLYAGHQLALQQRGVSHAGEKDEDYQRNLDDGSENECFQFHSIQYNTAPHQRYES